MELRPEKIYEEKIEQLKWLKNVVINAPCETQKDIEIRVMHLTKISADIGKYESNIYEILSRNEELNEKARHAGYKSKDTRTV